MTGNRPWSGLRAQPARADFAERWRNKVRQYERENAGLDPDNLPAATANPMDFGSGGGSGDESGAKAWRDIWGAGQGVGSVDDIPGAHDLVMRIAAEYEDTRARLAEA